MSKPKEHISKIRDEIETFHEDGHAKSPNVWSAVKDIELGLHALEKAIEFQMNGDKNGEG